MPIDVTVNTIVGAAPYDIYLCDNPVTICIYIDTVNAVPYVFQVPTILSSQVSFNLKVVDNNGCEVYQELDI